QLEDTNLCCRARSYSKVVRELEVLCRLLEIIETSPIVCCILKFSKISGSWCPKFSKFCYISCSESRFVNGRILFLGFHYLRFLVRSRLILFPRQARRCFEIGVIESESNISFWLLNWFWCLHSREVFKVCLELLC